MRKQNAVRAHEETKRGSGAEKDIQQDQQDGREYGHHLVFALHEYHVAKVNLVADFNDLAFAFRVFLDLCVDIGRREQSKGAENRRQ
jgi:hypothetical protein